jgi:hypothetical protein
MRNYQYISYIIPALLLLLVSCREVYYPEGLNTGKAIPVIKGQITENESPTVELSRAMNYENNMPDYISGAEVVVSDNEGNEVTLTESTPGHYVDAVMEMVGKVGNSYQLRVRMDEGGEFVSSMVTMPEKPTIDSVYADPGTKQAHAYDQYNRPITVTHEGLYLSTSLSADGDSTLFYRFNTSVLTESTCTKYPSTPNATPMFIWVPTTLDYVYSVDFTVSSSGGQVRPAHSLGFVRYFYDPALATNIYTAPLIIGYVVSLKVYSISPDVYNYYQSVGAQLNSNDQMFAPVPSQVKSNIRCTSNPDLPVTGVFEATSSRTYIKAFRFINLDTYEYVNLESFPEDIQPGSKLYFPPDFWVSFN